MKASEELGDGRIASRRTASLKPRDGRAKIGLAMEGRKVNRMISSVDHGYRITAPSSSASEST